MGDINRNMTQFSRRDWEGYKRLLEQLVCESTFDEEKDRVAFARSFCYDILQYLWKVTDVHQKWECRKGSFETIEISLEAEMLARNIAEFLRFFDLMDYAYLLGEIYTILLPETFRSANGIFYTPPLVAERLLDLLTAAGAVWSETTVLDPACGGGSFIVIIARKMLNEKGIKSMGAKNRMRHLECHLEGFEIDPFAATLTQCLLDILLYPESIEANRRLKPMVTVTDTVLHALTAKKKYDVIVGNPPYGRVRLDQKTRQAYARSLYGHANLYGLFIDAAIRLKESNGLIGFVTPTSFLGGKYFSNLRNVITIMAPPVSIDFISLRSGVFYQVLQETCLVVLGRNHEHLVHVSQLELMEKQVSSTCIGDFFIPEGENPWMIAREKADEHLIKVVSQNHALLQNYGYEVNTGPLVWNRLKTQISEFRGAQSRPIIWAEGIGSDGTFSFDYHYRHKMSFFDTSDKQEFLLCHQSVILVQRTTSKEEERRLKTCILPQEFIEKWNGVVVENHVNMIVPCGKKPVVSQQVLALILRSKIADRIFRCLSGSVAVSATELQAMPLPPLDRLEELKSISKSGEFRNQKAWSDKMESVVMRAYGMENFK